VRDHCTNDHAQRQADPVTEAVEACRKAIIDLTLEQKQAALDQLAGWIALEERSWLPEGPLERLQ
jgi:hypothetical protein